MTKTPISAGQVNIGDWFQVHTAGSITQCVAKEKYYDPYTREPAVRLTDANGNVWQGPAGHFAMRIQPDPTDRYGQTVTPADQARADMRPFGGGLETW